MDDVFLTEALRWADSRRGFCAPNPAVGAVVVRDGAILSTGCHWQAGAPHAEVEAIRRAGDLVAGSTVYVTLEPCSHHGRTPPCADLLVDSKVKEVVYAFSDPNPRVSGNGERRLREAGILCRKANHLAIDDFYRGYAHWWRTARPWVTAKIAMSLDGKIAGPGGVRTAITGEIAQRFTHRGRRRSDAILSTAKTVLTDNPRLDVRLAGECLAKPIYLLDRNLTLTADAEVFRHAQSVTIFHAENSPNRKPVIPGVKWVGIPEKNGQLDWHSLLTHVGKDGIHDLWVEAGGECFLSLWRENQLNRAYLYVAPRWLGNAATAAFNAENDDLARGLTCGAEQIRWQSLGDDALCEILW